jgi:inosine-uridine nucleoside N-ribohydrolase
VSGGAFSVPGTIHTSLPKNPNTVSEWNFYTDPLAAQVVLQSGARIALVPLDVTDVQGSSPLLFSRGMIQALRSAARGNAARLLARMVYLWQLTSNQFPATPVWDAAVAALAVDPQLGSWKELKVGVAQQPQAIAGQTYEVAEGPSIQVCYTGNQQAFEATYLNLVSGKWNELTKANLA